MGSRLTAGTPRAVRTSAVQETNPENSTSSSTYTAAARWSTTCATSSAVRSRCTSLYARIGGNRSSSAASVSFTSRCLARVTVVYSWSARCGRSSTGRCAGRGRLPASPDSSTSAAPCAFGAHPSAPSVRACRPSGPKARPPARTGNPAA